jgi:hypothetical protein
LNSAGPTVKTEWREFTKTVRNADCLMNFGR